MTYNGREPAEIPEISLPAPVFVSQYVQILSIPSRILRSGERANKARDHILDCGRGFRGGIFAIVHLNLFSNSFERRVCVDVRQQLNRDRHSERYWLRLRTFWERGGTSDQ